MADTPFTRSKEYLADETKRQLPRVLMAGTEAIKAAGTRWLPRFPAESLERYKTRMHLTKLRPFYQRAVAKAVGRVLSSPVAPSESVPAVLSGDWWENPAHDGRDMGSFLTAVLFDSLGDAGISYVLTDYPDTGASRQSLADAASRSPYLIHVRARDAIRLEDVTVNGRTWLRRFVRIEESTEKRETVREYLADGPAGPVLWRTWEHLKGAAEEDIRLLAEGELAGQTEIPVVPFPTGQLTWVGRWRATPPFGELAELCHLHLLKSSDKAMIEHRISAPPIHRVISAREELEEQGQVGAADLWWTTNPRGHAEYVEHSGTSLGALGESLDTLAKEIDSESMAPHLGRMPETATGAVIDETDTRTEVERWAAATGDGLDQVLYFAARYYGLEDGGTVTIKPKVTSVAREPERVRLKLDIGSSLNAPREATVDEMLRDGVISEQYAEAIKAAPEPEVSPVVFLEAEDADG